LEQYVSRPAELEHLSYLELIKQFKWNKRQKRWEPRAVEAVVQVYPLKWWQGILSSSVNLLIVELRRDPRQPVGGPNFPIAARRALMLYIPFRRFDVLFDPQLVENPERQPQLYDMRDTIANSLKWTTSFLARVAFTPTIFPDHILRLVDDRRRQDPAFEDQELIPELDDDDEWAPTPEGIRRVEEEYQRAARVIPLNQTMGRPLDFLGLREFDLIYNWDLDLQQFNLPPSPEVFIVREKERLLGTRDEIQAGEEEMVTRDMLNIGQVNVFDHICQGFRRKLDHVNPDSLDSNGFIVMGTAGVGKSFLIQALKSEIWRLAKERYGEERYPSIHTAIKLSAYTGKAAFQVGGVTLHSLLSIGDVATMTPLADGEVLRQRQREFENVHFLIIDEMSMIGLRLLQSIDTRLRQIVPRNQHKVFGGITVILFGDFYQLPPVGDRQLYRHEITPETHPRIQMGSYLYRSYFTKVFELTE
jgi:hypothetical protein